MNNIPRFRSNWKRIDAVNKESLRATDGRSLQAADFDQRRDNATIDVVIFLEVKKEDSFRPRKRHGKQSRTK